MEKINKDPEINQIEELLNGNLETQDKYKMFNQWC